MNVICYFKMVEFIINIPQYIGLHCLIHLIEETKHMVYDYHYYKYTKSVFCFHRTWEKFKWPQLSFMYNFKTFNAEILYFIHTFI